MPSDCSYRAWDLARGSKTTVGVAFSSALDLSSDSQHLLPEAVLLA